MLSNSLMDEEIRLHWFAVGISKNVGSSSFIGCINAQCGILMITGIVFA